jgi:uncharacterized CHY-type Zn-finger protein
MMIFTVEINVGMHCIPAHYISISHMSYMTPEQILKKNRFFLEPRAKLLICIECGKGKKECKCEKNVKCPYCNSRFEETDQLSKHIDRIHIGSGLLEGDFRKF